MKKYSCLSNYWTSKANFCCIKVDNFFPNFLFFLLLILDVAKCLCLIPTLIANSFFVFLGSASLFYCVYRHGIRRQKSYFCFLLFYSLFWMVSWIYNRNADIQEIFWPLGFMSIGLLLLNFELSFNFAKKFHIFFCVITGIHALSFADPELIVNRNSISALCVLSVSVMFILAYQKKENISFVYSVLASIVCVLAVGRGGVFLAVILAIESLLFEIVRGQVKVRNNVFIILIVIGIALSFLTVYYIDFLMNSDVVVNFKRRGLESERILIWGDYIDLIFDNFLDFIFGANVTGTEVLNNYHENLHNSFLMLHAKYGIFGVTMVIWLLYRALKFIIKTKSNLLLIPIPLILFRMNFDYTNFNGRLDVILIYYLLLPYYSTRLKAYYCDSYREC